MARWIKLAYFADAIYEIFGRMLKDLLVAGFKSHW